MIYLTWEFAQHSVFRKFLQERFVLQHLSPILGIAIAKIEVKALKQRAILLKLVRIKLVGIKLVQTKLGTNRSWLESTSKPAVWVSNHRF